LLTRKLDKKLSGCKINQKVEKERRWLNRRIQLGLASSERLAVSLPTLGSRVLESRESLLGRG
jgi:hypothetical protein